VNAGASRGRDLGEFLRARREGLTAANVGLPAGQRRRVRGLRREEVAQRADISVAWYTRLEQGVSGHPTAPVLDALARALMLDEDGRKHLRRLGGHPLPDDATDGAVPEAIRELIESMPHVPTVVMTVAFDIVGWNRAYDLLASMHGRNLRVGDNLLETLFPPGGPRGYVTNRASVARTMVAWFRYAAAEFPGNARFGEVVALLTDRSPEFRAIWDQQQVSRVAYDDVLRVRLGGDEVEFRPVQMRPLDHHGLQVHFHVPAGALNRGMFEAACRQAETLGPGP
jgi:transcriptional regulator with XRE-family HTH domain